MKYDRLPRLLAARTNKSSNEESYVVGETREEFRAGVTELTSRDKSSFYILRGYLDTRRARSSWKFSPFLASASLRESNLSRSRKPRDRPRRPVLFTDFLTYVFIDVTHFLLAHATRGRARIRNTKLFGLRIPFPSPSLPPEISFPQGTAQEYVRSAPNCIVSIPEDSLFISPTLFLAHYSSPPPSEKLVLKNSPIHTLRTKLFINIYNSRVRD